MYSRLQIAFAFMLSIGLLYLMTGTVSAHATIPVHAKVNKAIPAIGSTISQAPTVVTVFTLENINPDPNKSNLFVYSPAGDLISQGNATVSLTNPREMSITIKPDKANLNGVYVVRWITVSAEDGDPDQGAFVFTVNASAATTPTPVVTTTSSTAPSTTTTNGAGGTPTWVPIVVGVGALLVGLAVGLILGRRRSASSIGTMRKAVTQQSQEEESIKHP
ncbi:MAG TPA: copper resistance protein CopC [Ktedonobacteraceae bacterium]|jgi:methionine-rich copper-binding protein CopC|nr:copper resistance protein CopC [Ktedonobacteraceae bacterium]